MIQHDPQKILSRTCHGRADPWEMCGSDTIRIIGLAGELCSLQLPADATLQETKTGIAKAWDDATYVKGAAYIC